MRIAAYLLMMNGGPWLTILELFRWVRSWQGFHTLESSRCSDSNEEHRAPVVDCTQVSSGNAAGKRSQHRLVLFAN